MTGEIDTFQQRVFQIVAAIPYGKIATYGDVALMAGSPRASRQVGGVLRRLPKGSKLPWHRVINRKGEISLIGDDHQRQKSALQTEGVIFNKQGKIDLAVFRWLHAP